MNFKKIVFGELSAEEELDKHPELVRTGFYDFNDVLKKIIEGHEFLILGNKGSGKSIVGEHLRLTAGPQNDGTYRFVTKFGMKEFPFKSFTKIIPGSEGPETKLATAWQWSLLVQAILSFSQDSGMSEEFNNALAQVVTNFKRMGILPSTTLSDLARISSTRDFKVKILNFELSANFSPATATDLMFAQIVAYLKTITADLQSPNKHFLVIDGLDDQLSDRNKQLISVSSLIEEANDLNRLFREKNVPLKIVILCRKDIHSKLPGSNKNKISGYSVVLNWYEDQIDHSNKHIIKLAQFRAEKSGIQHDIFKENFEEKYPVDKSPFEYLLENTRYTPRDFLRLLTEIQKVKSCDRKISPSDIKNAVKRYSCDYFWPEIEDELDGYFERTDISTLKKALIHFQQREFKLNEFCTFCDNEQYNMSDIQKMFEVMYDCGAISNISENGKFFSKMRDGNDFNERQKISIHRGAVKALGLG